MSYLPLLDDDEVRYICSAIPARDIAVYFQRNPKEFAKLRPGFRSIPAAIAKLDIGAILFYHRNKGYISFFIETHISDWLNQIQQHREQCIKDGASKEIALIQTLPYCFFAGNVGLYLKLAKEEYSEEFILLLEAAVKYLKENNERIESQKEEIRSKDANIKELNTKLESNGESLEKAKRRLAHSEVEVKEFRSKSKEIEKLKAIAQKMESELEQFREEAKKQKETIRSLKDELLKSANSRQCLEEQIRAEIEKQKQDVVREQFISDTPKCPLKMNEFLEYLSYNFEALGIASSEEYFPLLKEHMSQVLFKGIPIILDRYAGLPLIRCVSNALTGQPNVKMLTYKESITFEEINSYLLSIGRIACLDNFIGNYNETTLFSLFNKHRGQIIFLTSFYNRTLKYVSEELLRYGQYLNLNKIAAFNNIIELTEDPSYFEEVDYTPQAVVPNKRFSRLLREVLNDFSYPNGIIERLCALVTNETDLCRILAFDVLPYCVDVLHISPFRNSERLTKYAGPTGRCQYKDLFQRWFA